MPSPNLRIAIIGAGPSGLTLGVLLHKHAIPFTIFDLRPEYTEEELARPAGSLDLHEDTGLAALRGCDLYDEFTSLTGDCTEAQRVCDKHGTILYADEGELSNRPEISRHKLVQLLLSHLPSEAIRWNHKLVSAKSSTTSGRTEVELDFGDNGKHIFDLAIGADGAWSRIRRLLTDVKPTYSGQQNVTINLRQITTRYPHLAKLIGTGTFNAYGDRHGIFSQRSVDDSARIYIFMSIADEHFATTSGLGDMTPQQAKDYLLNGDLPFKQWGAIIKELVTVACDDESINNPGAKLDIRPLYQLPIGHTWQHQPGATVIGDAAHLMCPWAGEGVNQAMRDSLLLSQAIIQAQATGGQDLLSLQKTLSPLIEKFEAEMVAGAKVEAEGTLENGEMMFGDDAAAAMCAFFNNVYHPE